MAKVYISEYNAATIASIGGQLPAPLEPAIATQVINTAATHQSLAFNAQTRFVRLHADGIVSYKFGTNPTAGTTDARLAANQTEYFGVPTGQNYMVDVIANT